MLEINCSPFLVILLLISLKSILSGFSLTSTISKLYGISIPPDKSSLKTADLPLKPDFFFFTFHFPTFVNLLVLPLDLLFDDFLDEVCVVIFLLN